MPAATAQAAPACRLARLHRHLQATSTTPAAAATNTKRKAIYIVCDSEGGAGMPEFWARNAEYDNPRRQEYRELLTRDCNAAVEGCIAAGAEEVIVSDDGMGGVNTIPELMDPRALWLRGPGFGGATPLMQGLDSSFAGVLLIGFHAMQDAPRGILAHTWSSAVLRRSTLNGASFGELAEYSLAADHDHNLPILLVHGDRAVCDEATALLGPRVRTVAVKEGVEGGSNTRALLIAPQRARQMLTDAARDAVAAALNPSAAELPPPKPYRVEGEVALRLELAVDEEAAGDYERKRREAWAEVGGEWPLQRAASAAGEEGGVVFEGLLPEIPRGLKML